MVVCSDKYGGIGLNNKLPWHCPEDLEYFKEQTLYKTVVMGRKTFESLPFEHGLPLRENVVLTNLFKPNTYCNKTLYTNAQGLLQYTETKRDIWIIGGKSIYDQLLPFVEEIHHTVISGEYECDTFMDVTQWTESSDWELKETKVLSDKAKVYIWRK